MFGTACFVAPRRLLTAAHVVGDRVVRRSKLERTAIEVRIDQPKANPIWLLAQRLWQDETLDAAVLEVTPSSPSVVLPEPLGVVAHHEGCKLESYGYPVAAMQWATTTRGSSAGRRVQAVLHDEDAATDATHIALAGTISAVKQNEVQATLSVPSASGHASAWRGASGMPLLTPRDGALYCVGVVTDAFLQFPQTLRGTPAELLLANRQFRELIHSKSRLASEGELESHCERLLARAPAARAALVSRAGCGEGQLFGWMVNAHVLRVLDQMVAVAIANPGTRQAMYDVACGLLALVFDKCGVPRREGEHRIVDVVAVDASLVELERAAAEGRPLLFVREGPALRGRTAYCLRASVELTTSTQEQDGLLAELWSFMKCSGARPTTRSGLVAAINAAANLALRDAKVPGAWKLGIAPYYIVLGCDLNLEQSREVAHVLENALMLKGFALVRLVDPDGQGLGIQHELMQRIYRLRDLLERGEEMP